MELHAVKDLCTTHVYMYDDVHCMGAELGAVKGAKSSVGYWYRVCSRYARAVIRAHRQGLALIVSGDSKPGSN